MEKNDKQTENYLDPQEEIKNYIRVGTDYYKKINVAKNSRSEECLVSWSYATLIQDNLKPFIHLIPKYDTFINEPSHVDYRQVIDNCYNKYFQLSHTPKKGDFPNITQFLQHIFGDQIEYGLDYLELLYLNPKQKLPVLLLISQERGTGKTTFLQFLGEIFENNVAFCGAEAIRSNFNSYWATKLLVCCDEMILKNRGDYEMIKNYTTQNQIKLEFKGKEAVPVEFYSKFVFCSNDEESPVIIEPGEDRYWVRKIPVLTDSDPNFMDKLKREIPAFLYYLKHRALSIPKSGRFYFATEHIMTEETRIIMMQNSELKTDILLLLENLFNTTNNDTYTFCLLDIVEILTKKFGKQYQRKEVKDILKKDWKLAPANNTSTYNKITYSPQEDGYLIRNAKGRYYTITKSMMEDMIVKTHFY